MLMLVWLPVPRIRRWELSGIHVYKIESTLTKRRLRIYLLAHCAYLIFHDLFSSLTLTDIYFDARYLCSLYQPTTRNSTPLKYKLDIDTETWVTLHSVPNIVDYTLADE